MTTEYNPISFNGEALTQAKLNQLANNGQYLFERMPRMRYTANGLTRDTSLKIISGKTPYTLSAVNYIYLPISFGTFFTAGCKPVVTATIETSKAGHRNKIVIWGLNQTEIDNSGFQAVITSEVVTQIPSGWVHWSALGY